MKTKTCTLAILFTTGLINSHAQDIWTQKANFGGLGRELAVGFSIGSKGYIGTGSFIFKDFWEYDPATNVWTQKADVGGPARQAAVGFSIGSKGYLGTGYDGAGTFFEDFWEYDPATNFWTQKANFGGGLRCYAVGFSIGSKGYIGTGFGNGFTYSNNFWEYDPSTDAWTQKANFGGTKRSSAVGFSIGSKGYIGTGEERPFGIVVKDFWEYDPATNGWTEKADFGGTARHFAVGFSIGSKGYIGTGHDVTFVLVKDFWEYDPATNGWTQKADFGGGARYSAAGFSIDGKGYIGTGYNGTGLYDFWEYTPGGAATYRDVILADNPIMYWRLGETSGTIAYDESANQRHATYIHQPGLGRDGAIADDSDTAVSFNGDNKYVGWIPTTSYSGSFTVEAWVQEKQVHSVETFFDTRTAAGEFSFDFKFDTLAGKEIHFDVGDGTQWLSTSGVPFDFKRNVWYYVAAVVTTTGATYYVDGSAIGSVTYSGIPLLFDPTHKVQIATNTRYDSEWFDGVIDEVVVYDYPLTADQIVAHYVAGTGNQ